MSRIKELIPAKSFGRIITYPSEFIYCIEEFKFDVPRYSNDIDGNRTKDAGGRDVVKSSIMVFTQMKQMIPNANGGFDKTYFKGMSPQEKGERLIQRFFKEPVVQIAAPTTTGNTTTPVINQAPEEETPF